VVVPGTPSTSSNFDATYSSQLSLETNSGVEHFSRDALGRRSISEKHHAALDARETGTYQRNKKLREERERERRIQLTKSAVYGGSIESLTARIASANAQFSGYKHAKTASSIEQRETQQQLAAAEAEARDQLGDLGPSLGMKKSSSLESLLPDKEHGGGLLVQHVEPGSRAERGRLRRDDRILEINGIKLIGLTESQVQEQLRRALESSELRVRVLRGDRNRRQQRDSKVAEMVEVATVSPTRKPHAAPVGTSLQVANTRKLGRKIEILLKKGPNGLGFSVTTRDNPAGGHCPIYIKNILPRGAAIEDGRLKPGDRLLEVDGTPMTGKTQTDVVAILRGMPAGATVRIVVSRQQELAEQADQPAEKSAGVAVAAPVAPPVTATAAAAPAPPIPVQKSSSARSLFTHQQQSQLNESQHFIDAGSESAASNVS